MFHLKLLAVVAGLFALHHLCRWMIEQSIEKSLHRFTCWKVGGKEVAIQVVSMALVGFTVRSISFSFEGCNLIGAIHDDDLKDVSAQIAGETEIEDLTGSFESLYAPTTRRKVKVIHVHFAKGSKCIWRTCRLIAVGREDKLDFFGAPAGLSDGIIIHVSYRLYGLFETHVKFHPIVADGLPALARLRDLQATCTPIPLKPSED